MNCPRCRGNGKSFETVQWSDGLGQVETSCRACEGSGQLGDLGSLIDRAVRAESQLAAEHAALVALRTHVALYLHYSSTDTNTNPRLCNAPNPSPYASVWLEYLKTAAALAPRLTAR